MPYLSGGRLYFFEDIFWVRLGLVLRCPEGYLLQGDYLDSEVHFHLKEQLLILPLPRSFRGKDRELSPITKQ